MTDNQPEEKIRVLIVDDISETRENLRKLLYFESDIEVVGAALSGQEGIDMARELRPDIVLMDINMPGVDGITATRTIAQEVPAVQVIMMSVQGETSYMRRAMLAGAREFLTKPFSSDELTNAIRRVYELGAAERKRLVTLAGAPQSMAPTAAMAFLPPQPEGKIITIFSPKGGVGCSTIATNLAIALKQEVGGKVALIDANLQFGDIGVLLNLDPTRTPTIADLIPQIEELDPDMLSSIMLPHSSGIRILMAPPHPEMAELIAADHMKTILEQMKKTFDYIIVDTWTSLHDPLLTVFDLSDRIVLLMIPEIPAIKNIRLFFEVAQALGYPAEKTVLVINKANRRSGIRAENIESSIKYPIMAQIAMDEYTATLSINHGIPFVISNKNSYISQGVFDLARCLVQELEKESVTESTTTTGVEDKSFGRLGRIFR